MRKTFPDKVRKLNTSSPTLEENLHPSPYHPYMRKDIFNSIFSTVQGTYSKELSCLKYPYLNGQTNVPELSNSYQIILIEELELNKQILP